MLTPCYNLAKAWLYLIYWGTSSSNILKRHDLILLSYRQFWKMSYIVLSSWNTQYWSHFLIFHVLVGGSSIWQFSLMEEEGKYQTGEKKMPAHYHSYRWLLVDSDSWTWRKWFTTGKREKRSRMNYCIRQLWKRRQEGRQPFARPDRAIKVIFIDLPVKMLYRSTPKALCVSLKEANKCLIHFLKNRKWQKQRWQNACYWAKK